MPTALKSGGLNLLEPSGPVMGLLYQIKKWDIQASQEKFSEHWEISFKNRTVPGKTG